MAQSSHKASGTKDLIRVQRNPKILPSIGFAVLSVGKQDYEWHEGKQKAGTTLLSLLNLTQCQKKTTAAGKMLEEKSSPPGKRLMLNLEEFVGELKMSL